MRLSRIGGDSRSCHPSAGASFASSLFGFVACTVRRAGGSPCKARNSATMTPSTAEEKGATPPHHALHEQQDARRDGGAHHAGAGVIGEHLGDAVRSSV